MTRTVDERDLEELESALIGSDIGVQTTTEILDALRERARHHAIEGGEELRASSRPASAKSSKPRSSPVDTPATPPKVTFLVGVNGAGKTTTIGKLAAWSRAQGRSRPALRRRHLPRRRHRAAGNLGRPQRRGNDQDAPGRRPRAVLFDAVTAAKARKIDDLIVDTAGRLHTKAGLMDELKRCAAPPRSLIPDAPHEVLLVMDATTGQNGLQQARKFTESAGVTGIVLTKLDGTAKGGIVVAIARELNLPVRFVGVGEKMDDLLEFSAEAFVDALVG